MSLIAAVEAAGVGVDLGPQAGRDDDRLAQVIPAGEVVQRLGRPGGRHRHRFEDPERGGAVVESYDDDRHAWRRSLAWAVRPDRISSSMSQSSAGRQSTSSVDRPAAFSWSRASDSNSASKADLGSELGRHLAPDPAGQGRAVPGGRHRRPSPALAGPRPGG